MEFVQRHGRQPSPVMADQLIIGSVDLTHELVRELVPALRAEGMPEDDQDNLAEYLAGDGTDPFACLFVWEYEPELFGFRLALDESLRPALRLEQQIRADQRESPEWKAMIERGRAILGLSRILGPDGKPLQ